MGGGGKVRTALQPLPENIMAMDELEKRFQKTFFVFVFVLCAWLVGSDFGLPHDVFLNMDGMSVSL